MQPNLFSDHFVYKKHKIIMVGKDLLDQPVQLSIYHQSYHPSLIVLYWRNANSHILTIHCRTDVYSECHSTLVWFFSVSEMKN